MKRIINFKIGPEVKKNKKNNNLTLLLLFLGGWLT